MKNHAWLLSLLLVAACGDKISSHEDALEAQLDVIHDTTAVLKTIKDKASAEAAKPKLDALEKRMKDIEEQMKKLEGTPDPKLQQKAMTEMAKAMQELMAAMAAVPDDPEIQKIVGDMDMR